MPSVVTLKQPAILTLLLGLLVGISALAGLVAPGFYGVVDPALRPGCYSQDWIALGALPVLAWGVRAALRGSLRGLALWAGLLGYYLYGYLVYSFAPLYTVLYPAYPAIVGLAVFSAVLVGGHLDGAAFHARLAPRLSTLPVIVLFGATALSLAPVWMMQMIAAMREGRPSPFATIHVLDLSLVFPTLATTAVGLWRRRPWSYALAGPMLVLCVTMTFSLVVGEVLAFLRAAPDPLPISIAFAVIALAAGLLTRRYMRDLHAAG